MSRIKRISAWTLISAMLLVPSFASSEEALQAPVAPEEANYVTDTTRTGSFIKTAAARADTVYPIRGEIKYEGDLAKFVEYLVTRGDEVKAGDVVARVTIESSVVALEDCRLTLLRAKEDYEAETRAWRGQLDEANENLAAMTDDFDRETQKLVISALQLSFERYCHQQEYAIDTLERQLAELEEKRSMTELLSPIDGIVEDTVYKKSGDAVGDGELLVTVYSTDQMLLVIDNTPGYYRYNMPVTLETGYAKNRVILTGRVVAADNVVPEASRTGKAYILVDPNQEDVEIKNTSAECETIRIDNVLLLSRRSIVLQNGKYYVTKLKDGRLQKRYVQIAYNNIMDTWVLLGAKDGDVVVID